MDTFIISTLGSTIGSALQPIIENATGAFLGNRFHELNGIQKDQKKPAQDAIASAFEEWIIAILKNLQAQEYEDNDLRQFFKDYKKAIETFLNDPEVVEELLKPFFATTTDYRIDSQLLVRRWTALNLRELPEEFEAASVSRAYLRRVKNAGIVTPELRKLFLAQLAQQRTHYLESIRGVWPDFDLDNYAKRVETRYQVLDLSALTPPSRDDVEDGRLLLKDVFVPQMVRESRPPRELPKEIVEKLYDKGELHREELPDEFRLDEFKRLQQSWTQAKPESVLTAVTKQKNQRLILLGDPGSGKSTLARYLLLSVLADTAEVFKTSEVFAGHLPLLVELRNYIGEVASNHCAGFLEYFHHLGKTQGYTLNHLELKEQLKTRPSLIIFDGLDEIFEPKERDKITQEIIGFALEYQDKARVLVTSRIIGYQANALQAADFREYTLQDLAPAQIKTFAQGWYKLLVFRDKPEESAYRYQRIETALQHSPAIRQLAGNPLLLTMIAIIAKHQELPRERAKLYEHATKVLCHHWDVTGHKIPVAETPADFMREDDKLELLRRIAWRMQASAKGLAGNFILSEDLRDEMADYLRTRWQLSAVDIGRIGSGMIAQLRERNFILCLYGAQLYGFVHRTFLEYFCAAEIVDRLQPGAVQGLTAEALKEDIFRAHYQDSAWHEVLRLICGMVKPLIAGELISAIVPKRKEAFKKTDDLILAVQCLAEVADINQIAEVAERVLGSLCGWFEIDIYKPHKKEQQFEEHAVPAVETIGKNWPKREIFLSWLSEPKKKVCSEQGVYAFGKIVAALWADGETTRQSLIALSKKNVEERLLFRLFRYLPLPNMAFDALARCFKPQHETYSLLQKMLQDNKHEYVRSAAVSSLAEHYPERPETYSLLQQVVQDDKHKDVRLEAIFYLVEHYPSRPETYSLLQQVVQDDKDNWVRRHAVFSLAEHYQNRPETYSRLQQVIQDDKHENVRRAAVSSLAEHYPDRPKTYSLLQQVVQEDKNKLFRSDVVFFLAKHYQNRSETYSLLQQLVQDSKHEDVRSAAVSSLAEQYSDHPETYSRLQQVIQDDKHENVRSAAVSSLAEHYQDHPETYSLLQQFVQDGKHEDVRRAAVSSLAEHYPERPETYSLLQQVVQEDKNKLFRSDVVFFLAKHYQNRSETYSLLQQLVQDSKHEDVRSAAVSSLAEQYSDHPETYSRLQQVIQDDKHENVRSAAVSSLAEHYPERPETYSLLQQVVQDDKNKGIRSAAVSSLAKYYSQTRPEIYSLLQQVVQDDKDNWVRHDAVCSLAKYYQDRPETYSLLQQLVQDGKHEDVRRAAVSSLAEQYSDHPETYSLLQQVVQNDKDEYVRREALSSLVEHYPERPEIYSLLQQVVQDDKHEEVRRAVVSSLAEQYSDHPDTYSLLQQVIQDDKHQLVRQVAVSSLAKHYQNRPETYSLLQQLVQDSKHEDVREVAVSSLAEHYPDRPETYSLLQQVIQDGKPENVWYAAVFSLAEHYPDYPETYSLLQQLVQNDKHEDVRSQAVSYLAKYYPDRPEVLPMLQQIMTDEEASKIIRRSAVGVVELRIEDTWHTTDAFTRFWWN
jgi:uncharacterized membrane-anchored protein YjiN (DUF445 family)/energy-coupling factor transporter ATP-binding protein EcfA2